MLFVLVSALLAGAPAQASAAPTAAAAAQPVKEKKVCKSEVTTGSIMPKRTCKLQSEWDAMAAANSGVRDQMTQMQQTSQTVSGSR